jgi:hypothetical protein
MALHVCPHCLQPGVSSLQKLNSLFLAPARCARCDKRSSLDFQNGLRAMIAWVVLSWIFIGIAMYERMPLYLLGTIPALLFAVDKFIMSAPLRRIDG